MASKIQSHNFDVAITPYKVENSSADEFNLLNVRTAYDDRRKYFYVDLHAGWSTGWGGFGCILMGDNNPLTAPQYVKVKDAPKNSQKTINEMGTNLETGKEAIAWLFDHREWQKLNVAVRNIALYGYTEQFRKQMEELMNKNTNNQNKEDNTMRLNMNKKNETKNVQATAQVMNNTNATAVEDAVAEEVVENVAVGEATIDNIMPSMSAPVEEEPVKVEGSEYTVKDDEGKDVTFESVVPAAIAKAATEGTTTTMLTRVRLTTFTTKRGETAPRIVGFSGEDDPRWKQHYAERMALAKAVKEAKAKDPKAKGQSDPFGASWMTDHQTGSVTYCMTFGVRYMDVAKQLCEAYNTTDRNLWAQAEQAVIDCKAGIVSGYQAEKAARQAAREAKKQQATTQPAAAPQGKTYTAADMEATIREAFGALAGAMKADVKQFEPLIAAAMKKAA